MEEIRTKNAPVFDVPLSQAIKHDDLIWVSGNIGCESSSGITDTQDLDTLVSQDVGEQTAQTLENISSILEEAGTSLNNVVKVTVLLDDVEDFPAVNDVYEDFFSKPYPARSAYGVNLAADIDVEIEAVAVIP